MGQETVYCVRCGSRVVGHDIEQGKAYRIAGKAVCANCITPEEKNNISSSAVARNKSTTRVRAVPKPGPGTSTKLPQVRSARPTPSKAPLIAAAAAGVLLLGAVAFWMMSKSTPPPDEVVVERKAPPPPKPPVTPPPPEEKKTEDPQLAGARAAIEAARATSKADLETQRAAWEEAARK